MTRIASTETRENHRAIADSNTLLWFRLADYDTSGRRIMVEHILPGKANWQKRRSLVHFIVCCLTFWGKIKPCKACAELWRKRGWSTPHPPAPSPTRGEGERRLVRNDDLAVESCPYCQVSNSSKLQKGTIPQTPDKPCRGGLPFRPNRNYSKGGRSDRSPLHIRSMMRSLLCECQAQACKRLWQRRKKPTRLEPKPPRASQRGAPAHARRRRRAPPSDRNPERRAC